MGGHAQSVKDIGTPELLNIYISEGDVRPENEHIGRELSLRDPSELDVLLKKEAESRRSAGELLMVAIIASSTLDPQEAKSIVERVAERLGPNYPEPIDGSMNPLIPNYLALAFASIERKEQALAASSNLGPASDIVGSNFDGKTTSGTEHASATPVGQSPVSKRWPMVAVAMLAILWLLLKMRKFLWSCDNP